MRIALVIDSFDPLHGGLAQWTAEFAGYLVEQGHEVEVVAFEAAAGHGLAGAAIHLLPSAAGELARARAVARHFAARPAAARPDVVHDTGTSWSGDVFHPQTGSRLLSLRQEVASFGPLRRLRGTVSPKMIWRRHRMVRLERLQAVQALRIVAVSRQVRDLLAGRHGVSHARITVVPNGVNTAHFARERLAPLREEARRALGAEPGCTLFLAAAYNPHLKGLARTLRALGRLAASGAQVKLVVAGPQADAHWLRLVEAEGLAGRVAMLGPVAAMDRLFAAADAFVHPTRWDACSRATLEAMAAGLPTITTAADGASELMEDGRTAFILPRGCADALAERMRALLDPLLRARLGAAAAAAVARCSQVANFRGVEAVLEEAAALRRNEDAGLARHLVHQ